MTVKYSLIQKVNPQAMNEPKKYYANIQRGETLDLALIAERLSYGSTLTEGDVWAVLKNLVTLIKTELQDGNVIKIDKLGSLKLQLYGTGATTPEEFLSKKNIKDKKIIFSIDTEMKKFIQNVKLVRVADKKTGNATENLEEVPADSFLETESFDEIE